MAKKRSETHTNVSMEKAVHKKATKLQADEKLITISAAIEKAIDFYNKYKAGK